VKAAIYARVSSAAQRERDTIASQLRTLPEFVARQGWELVGTYVDDGASAKAGRLTGRPGFARLLADAAARKFDVIAIVDVDRITRSEDIAERGAILGAFQAAGVKVASASTGQILDLSTSQGDLLGALATFFAAEENRKRRERTIAGKITAIGRSRKPAGPTPYGLAYDRAAGVWSVDDRQAAVMREVLARIAGGASCEVIADDLHARGVPPPGRKAWSRQAVYRVARARHLLGQWTADKRRRLVIDVPPIVDEATWHAAQAALARHGKRGLRRTKHTYLLEGLVACGACGAPILIRSPTPQRRGRIGPAAYVCRRRKLDVRDGLPRCDAPIVPVADLDGRAWAAVIAALSDPAQIAALAARQRTRAAEVRDWTADAAGYRAHLARLTRVEAQILARYRRGTISDAALDGELAGLARERAAVAEQLATAERAASSQGPQVAPEVLAARLADRAATATPAQRRAILAAIVEHGAARLDGDRITLVVAIKARSPAVAGGIALVTAPGCSDVHEEGLRIRVVA
jgi:DNA invertase Pin-like site-specific DNA recombinase